MSEDRWHDLNLILRRTSPLAPESFIPDTEENQDVYQNQKKFEFDLKKNKT
jgi:hypothetical protein